MGDLPEPDRAMDGNAEGFGFLVSPLPHSADFARMRRAWRNGARDCQRGRPVQTRLIVFPRQKTNDYKPGGAPAEMFFHELVHAFRLVTEKATDRLGPLNPYLPNQLKKYPEFDVVEELFCGSLLTFSRRKRVDR
jgi:hypothetical protein